MNDLIIRVDSSKLNVQIINENELTFGKEKFNYELNQISNNFFLLKLNNNVFELTVEKLSGNLFKVLTDGNYFDVTVHTALQEKAIELLEKSLIHRSPHTDVKAPMPGLILKIRKGIGEKVERGESVIILEAMKMENDLKAPTSGLIEKIFVTEGSAVDKGTKLLSIE